MLGRASGSSWQVVLTSRSSMAGGGPLSVTFSSIWMGNKRLDPQMPGVPHPTHPYDVPEDPEAGGPAHLCVLFHHGPLHLLVPFPVSPIVKVHGEPGWLWAQRASPETEDQNSRDPQPRGSSCTGLVRLGRGRKQVSLCLQAIVLILSVSWKRGATSFPKGRIVWTSGNYQHGLFGSSVSRSLVGTLVSVLGQAGS